jgi:hypothetical protein
MAKLNLSLADVKVNTGSGNGFSIVPTGKYEVVVGSADVGDTKNGKSLIVGYAIVSGEHEGKLVKDFLNIVNPSAEAQRISHERLATIAWATNAPLKNGSLEDSDDLLGKDKFEILVEQVDDGEYKNMKIKAVICTRDLSAPVVPVKPAAKMNQPWKKN